MIRIGLFWRTINNLTARQLVFQLINRLRKPAQLKRSAHTPTIYVVAVTEADKPVVWDGKTFTFLNQSVCFPAKIDWNYARYGKLWTYHLNYFDGLNQPDVAPANGLSLIHDFVAQTAQVRDGLEPYPTSLRIINWIQFLSRHQIDDSVVNAHLFAQARLLRRRLEYHLMGNHLLENGFALLAAALFFRQKRWYQCAGRVIRTELTRQIMTDGGHDERSPMYHQILLDRLLTLWLMLRHDNWHNDPAFTHFLAEKATHMMSWLEQITFSNGDIPTVNDATFGMAPTTAQLRQKHPKIQCLNTAEQFLQRAGLSTSGYRMFRRPTYELFIDVGAVGPDHQPGHAHADTFSFILHAHNRPVLVDAATSTYQIGARRAWERSTAAHNTVEINGLNSSEVWAGFRVGRRARVKHLLDTSEKLVAQHNGYSPAGIIHERTWEVESTQIRIIDRLLTTSGQVVVNQTGVARFYAHPTVFVTIHENTATVGPVAIVFSNVTNLNFTVTGYAMAQGFNQLQAAQCLEVTFAGQLETVIVIPE